MASGFPLKWVSITALLLSLWIYFRADTFTPDLVKSKRVVITGASTGIGEELAYQYSRMGARLVINARRRDVLRKVGDICTELGAQQVEILVGDMENPNVRTLLIQLAEEALGGIDQLILNHVFVEKGLHTGAPENVTIVERTIAINFVAYVDLASKAMPLLRKSNGSIGAISSLAGKVPAPTYLAYSSAKHALQGFFSGLLLELEHQQIDVSVTICTLGLIGTDKVAQDIRAGHIKDTWAAPVDATALAIIQGVTLRHREIYYPFYVRFVVTLHKFFPSFIEGIMLDKVTA